LVRSIFLYYRLFEVNTYKQKAVNCHR